LIEGNVRTYLLTIAGISNLVGTSPGRIWPVVLPAENKTLPAITYTRVSSAREKTMDSGGVPHPRIQYTCWGNTYDAVNGLAQQVIAALNAFSGAAGTATVYVSWLEDERDAYEDSPLMWRRDLDFEVWIPETDN
jgi:hypothetical protein